MTQNTNLKNLYYSENEISDFLGISIGTLRTNASRRKGAPRTRIGKTVLYNRESFHNWLQEHEIDYNNLGRAL